LDLFNQNSNTNLLPYDGDVVYYGTIFSNEEANKYYEELLINIKWMNDQAIIFGKLITTKRKVAWYGDKAFPYTYSKTTKTALPWTPALLELKTIAEQKTKASYNSCLLNLYHDGSEGMTWHSDGEKDLQKNGSIGSMSFGAIRKFAFKHKTSKQRIDIILDHGSLLEMKGATQTNWLHRLPPTKKVKSPRINLTFRTIENSME
jgi:alkylated DNA repair dioxygenase AlkB